VASGGCGVASGQHQGQRHSHAGSPLPVVTLLADDGVQIPGSLTRPGGAGAARTVGSDREPGTRPD
jgi:hypothetical protein